MLRQVVRIRVDHPIGETTERHILLATVYETWYAEFATEKKGFVERRFWESGDSFFQF